MSMIESNYDRMARRTGKPCHSITFWRTVDGRWGARAGIGDHVFGDDLADAIERAVDNAIAADLERKAKAITKA